MKKTCSNCRWWREGNESDKAYHGQDSGDCACPKFRYVGNIEHVINSDELGYWDTESYSAGFVTGKEFGCVHFQKKA